jgi:hypothetical protein
MPQKPLAPDLPPTTDEEPLDLITLVFAAEGTERIRQYTSAVWLLLNAADELYQAITNAGTPKQEVVRLLRRLERRRPLALLTEGEANRHFNLARGVAAVPYWPGTGYGTNAHQAAVVSAYALLQHVREAAGWPMTGRVDWQRVSLLKVRKHLGSLPPFDIVPRLNAEMRGEVDVALRQWPDQLPAAQTRGEERNGPRWDKERRELWLRDKLLNRFSGHPAANQVRILASFEELGWPPRIDSPFPRGATQRLKDAVLGLNRAIEAQGLRFRLNGTGDTGLCWELT